MKHKIAISIDKELLDWIKEQIRTRRFANVSHAIEYCVHKIMQKTSREPDILLLRNTPEQENTTEEQQ